ncbi:MAG: adenosine deaminase [Clostridia bacterium]|nr:adenosine deaminase [Clostridia bacterium]
MNNIIPNCLIDLHLHLDGSLSLDAVKNIALHDNINIPSNDNELKEALTLQKGCKNLNEYLKRFDLPISILQSSYALQYATEDLCNRLHDIGCIYAEIRYAPQKHCQKGLSQEVSIKAVLNGIKNSPIPCGLILCCMREGWENSKENLKTVNLAVKYQDFGVYGLDLAGAEALYPNEIYKDLFTAIKNTSLPYTIHSGEALGAKSVDIAIDYGAKRIGHGIRAYEDKNTLKRIVENNIPLEFCPTSNINTFIFEDYKDIPILEYMQKGAIITLNSDNMSISNTDIRQEFNIIKNTLNLSNQDIKNLLLNSAKSSFADEGTKKKLISKIDQCF